MSAEKVAVFLTKKDTQILRRLIVDEAKRCGLSQYQHDADMPTKYRPLRTVARKIWEARQHFDGPR